MGKRSEMGNSGRKIKPIGLVHASHRSHSVLLRSLKRQVNQVTARPRIHAGKQKLQMRLYRWHCHAEFSRDFLVGKAARHTIDQLPLARRRLIRESGALAT